MTIALVQSAFNSGFGTGVSKDFASNVSAGSLIVVTAAKRSGSSDTFLASDCTKSAGSSTIGAISVASGVQQDVGGSNFVSEAIWYCLVTGSGGLTIDISGAPFGSDLCLTISEWSGTFTSPLEASINNAHAGSASIIVTNNATSAGAALFVANCINHNITSEGGLSPDAAFTEIRYTALTGNFESSTIYRLVSAGTTDQGEWGSADTFGGYAATMAVFFEGGAAGQPSMRRGGMAQGFRPVELGREGVQFFRHARRPSGLLVPDRSLILPQPEMRSAV